MENLYIFEKIFELVLDGLDDLFLDGGKLGTDSLCKFEMLNVCNVTVFNLAHRFQGRVVSKRLRHDSRTFHVQLLHFSNKLDSLL